MYFSGTINICSNSAGKQDSFRDSNSFSNHILPNAGRHGYTSAGRLTGFIT